MECVPKAHSLTSKLSVTLNRFHESYEKKGVCVCLCAILKLESQKSHLLVPGSVPNCLHGLRSWQHNPGPHLTEPCCISGQLEQRVRAGNQTWILG